MPVSRHAVDRGVQRARLAAMRQAQPVEVRITRARRAQFAERGYCEAEAGRQQCLSAVGGTVVGNHDLRGTVDLFEQRRQRDRKYGRLVMRRNDDAHLGQAPSARRRVRRHHATRERPRLHRDEEQQQRVIEHVRNTGRPCDHPVQKERSREQQDPQCGHAAVNQPARPRRLTRHDARRHGGKRIFERLPRRFTCAIGLRLRCFFFNHHV
jgi:hypothetical protein